MRTILRSQPPCRKRNVSHDNSSLQSSMYEIRPTLQKGLGVFAKSLIPKGTRIFSEPPLLALRPDQSSCDIYSSATLLSEKERKQLSGLSSHVTGALMVVYLVPKRAMSSSKFYLHRFWSIFRLIVAETKSQQLNSPG